MLAALMPTRNEAWCLRFTLPAVLHWCDIACVLIHACDDETEEIAEAVSRETPGRVFIVREPDPEWHEAGFRQRLMVLARTLGATAFAPVDADEVLSTNLVPHVREIVGAMRPGALIEVPWINLWRSPDLYRSDAAPHGRMRLPLVFHDAPWLHYANDLGGYSLHKRVPRQIVWHDLQPVTPEAQAAGGLMHLQRVVWERALARCAWHKMDELLRFPHYRGGPAGINEKYDLTVAEPETLELRGVPIEWWAYPMSRHLIDLQREPWEAGEVRRLLALHGPERFAALDLHGVA